MGVAIGLIGFGEAAQTFVGDRRWRGAAQAYDIKMDALASTKADDLTRLGVRACANTGEAVANVVAVLSLVTADQAVAAARAAAGHIAKGTLYFDMNSVAPATKRAASAVIEANGGRYIDTAIMAPVTPAALDAPLLLSGHAAENAGEDMLREMGFQCVRCVGTEVGRASLIKMVRSIAIKGAEALAAECMLAAHAGGVVDEVLGSLGDRWREQANYNLERVLAHGVRRAAEMEEVEHTLRDLGVAPRMTRATVVWQRDLGAMGASPVPADLAEKLVRLSALCGSASS